MSRSGVIGLLLALSIATSLIVSVYKDHGGSINKTRSPYPPSPIIKEILLDWSTHERKAPGSDNWPITWADDNHQYTSWGDGGGFSGTDSDGRASLGIARIEGEAYFYAGYNVLGGGNPENPENPSLEGKSYGILSVFGKLYLWVSPGSGMTNFNSARLYKSEDHGATWVSADWSFQKKQGLVYPTFLQFGKDYEGAKNDYVYIYASHLKSEFSINKPGEISLIRVPIANIMDRNTYEFYRGTNKEGKPVWTSDIDSRKPVYVNSEGGVGYAVSVSYNPGLGRYLLITAHTSPLDGNLGIFDAPEPWGPWTTVAYIQSFGSPAIEANTFYWNFSNKWASMDGRKFVMIFTGIGKNDSWNTVRGTFVVDSGQTPSN